MTFLCGTRWHQKQVEIHSFMGSLPNSVYWSQHCQTTLFHTKAAVFLLHDPLTCCRQDKMRCTCELWAFLRLRGGSSTSCIWNTSLEWNLNNCIMNGAMHCWAVVNVNTYCLFSAQRDMLDVNQIMKDLASMVHEQGDTIGKMCSFLVNVVCLFVPDRIRTFLVFICHKTSDGWNTTESSFGQTGFKPVIMCGSWTFQSLDLQCDSCLQKYWNGKVRSLVLDVV